MNGLTGFTTNVQLTLDITGGFNGDLNAYLAGPGGGFVVMFNRTGLSGGNLVGYNDAGMDVSLSDGAVNGDIHYYHNVLNPGGAQLTGSWSPDGRNIDPQSAAGIFDSTASTALFSSFVGSDPNGTWTFFIADLSAGGGQPILNSLTLTIVTVPEPTAWALFVLGLLLVVIRLSGKGATRAIGK